MKIRMFSCVGIVLSALILLAFSGAKAESDELKVIETPATAETQTTAETQATPDKTELPAAVSHFDPLKYKPGPDDVVEISVMRHPELSGT